MNESEFLHMVESSQDSTRFILAGVATGKTKIRSNTMARKNKGMNDLAQLKSVLVEEEQHQEDARIQEADDFLLDVVPDLGVMVEEFCVSVDTDLAEIDRRLDERKAAYIIRDRFFAAVRKAKSMGLQSKYDELHERESMLNTTVVVHGVKVAKAPAKSPELEAIETLRKELKRFEQEIGGQVALGVCSALGVEPMTLDAAFDFIKGEDKLFNQNNKE